jgi:hypothetical protein
MVHRFLLAAAIALLPGPAGAQAPAQAPATIRGTVLDRAGGAPIADISVQLQDLGIAVRTDEHGRFELAGIPPGRRTLYISLVGFILVKRTVEPGPGETVDVTILLSEGTGTYSEEVTVTANAFEGREKTVAVQQALGSADIQNLRNLLTNDPMRTVQVLPGVTSGDDFRSEFAVRGSGFSRMAVTFDGVPAPFLLHTVQLVEDGGSIAMINGDILDGITLLSGSYPQRYGNRLGAELDFTVREGSRDRRQARLGVSGTDASVVAEGPLGGKRGSWLASARKSYLDLLVRQISDDIDFGFGFSDAQAKLVYDAAPAHRLDAVVVIGRSRLDRVSETDEFNRVSDGRNASGLANVGWRFTPSPSVTVTQRLALALNEFANRNEGGFALDSGSGRDLTWRAELLARVHPALMLEAGGQGQWQQRSAGSVVLDDPATIRRRLQRFTGRATHASAYAMATWSPLPNLALTPGARVDRWSLSDGAAASPWMQAELRIRPRLVLRAGTGLHRQFPGFEESIGIRAGRALREERAYHADLALEHRLDDATRWQVAIYNRAERDVLRLPSREPRLDAGQLIGASGTSRWVNALDGYARGVELLVQRRSIKGVSGWASYSFGFNRYEDRTTGERFDGDFDQRHAVNVYGHLRVSDRLSLAAKLRAGSNVPAPGYWERRGEDYFIGSVRNGLRVPAYARLDVRASRVFDWRDKRMTLFVEAMNVLAHDNVRFNTPRVDSRTRQVFGIFESMIPLVPSAGILLEF